MRACPRPRPNDAASRVASPAHRRLRAAPRRPPRRTAPQPAPHSPSISVKTALNSQSCCAASTQQRTRNNAAGSAAPHPPSPAALRRARAARRPRSPSACRDAFAHTCGHPHGTPRGERRLQAGPSHSTSHQDGEEVPAAFERGAFEYRHRLSLPGGQGSVLPYPGITRPPHPFDFTLRVLTPRMAPGAV